MAMRRNTLPDKQCIEGVCQFCGREAIVQGGDETPSANPSDGWIALMDVSPWLMGVYGEWCSMECFRNDLLRQAKVESAERHARNRMVIRPC